MLLVTHRNSTQYQGYHQGHWISHKYCNNDDDYNSNDNSNDDDNNSNNNDDDDNSIIVVYCKYDPFYTFYK